MKRKPLVLAVSLALAACAAGVQAQAPTSKPRMAQVCGTCHTVGPHEARQCGGKDVQAYHVIGFEGMAEVVKRPPEFGFRQFFLPSFCMMQVAHTGVVNMVLEKSTGMQVRVEDIRIL